MGPKVSNKNSGSCDNSDYERTGIDAGSLSVLVGLVLKWKEE